jgi:hypothetical protein
LTLLLTAQRQNGEQKIIYPQNQGLMIPVPGTSYYPGIILFRDNNLIVFSPILPSNLMFLLRSIEFTSMADTAIKI